jgi:hypothetical protein
LGKPTRGGEGRGGEGRGGAAGQAGSSKERKSPKWTRSKRENEPARALGFLFGQLDFRVTRIMILVAAAGSRIALCIDRRGAAGAAAIRPAAAGSDKEWEAKREFAKLAKGETGRRD